MLIGQPVASHDEALSAAYRLMEKGCKKHVLITLGKHGALLLSRNDNDGFLEPVSVTAPDVKAIDTTVRSKYGMKKFALKLLFVLGCRRLLSGSACVLSGVSSGLPIK